MYYYIFSARRPDDDVFFILLIDTVYRESLGRESEVQRG